MARTSSKLANATIVELGSCCVSRHNKRCILKFFAIKSNPINTHNPRGQKGKVGISARTGRASVKQVIELCVHCPPLLGKKHDLSKLSPKMATGFAVDSCLTRFVVGIVDSAQCQKSFSEVKLLETCKVSPDYMVEAVRSLQSRSRYIPQRERLLLSA